MIKRYTPDCSIHMNHEMAFMRELAGGEYVKYSDHQQLLDELAVGNSMYREAIRTARRLINVDEMGDADVVLAKAECSISSNAAAVREIEAQAVEKLAERWRTAAKLANDDGEFRAAYRLAFDAVRASQFATELREGK
ncbi:hypothetical protein [Serratia rhizosphaerae]|uniref:Uncharacterized protein n=1 Tax=Serratia rhizosphaerae TaxID=2597702 RepID=A0ABX6GH60_9GAMM|nr:hypothetical protein [Serratia rhizosphaerae]QHA85574.1 hypothetical protein FO014_00485 [Serratia rhizosphaerae]